DIGDSHEASDMAERIAAMLRRPMSIEGREVVISTSIGVALCNMHETRPDDVLRAADLELYKAKDAGRARYALFDPRLEASAIERMELETALRVALERDEFQVHYQPIIDFSTGQIAGWEALIRWRHPQRGMISPAAFIPVAEETGLIVPI